MINKKSNKKVLKRKIKNPSDSDIEYRKEYIKDFLLNEQITLIYRGNGSKAGDLKPYIQIIGKLKIENTGRYGIRYNVFSSKDPSCFSTFNIYDILDLAGGSKEIIIK